jgi:hypothetical protein
MSVKFIHNILVLSALTAGIPAFGDILSTTGSVSVSNGAVAFYPLGGNSGSFEVGPPDTGVFASLPGTAGTIENLNSLPVNQTLNIPDFMTFAGAPNLSITLTELVGGTLGACSPQAAAAGQACSPTGTPYNLSNETATSSVGSAMVEGYLVNSNQPGVTIPISGIFTTQFVNMSYQQLVNTIDNGGTIDSTYSAEFVTGVTPTPEPATLALIPAGLLLLAFGRFGQKLRARFHGAV